MVQTSVLLFFVSTAIMMLLVRLVQELLVSSRAKLKAEEDLVHTVAATRTRLNFYINRTQELDSSAFRNRMGLDSRGTRAILNARRAVTKVDECLTLIELLIESSDSNCLERATQLITHLNGKRPVARVSRPELYYAWELQIASQLNNLSLEILRAGDRLSQQIAA